MSENEVNRQEKFDVSLVNFVNRAKSIAMLYGYKHNDLALYFYSCAVFLVSI